MKKRYLSLGLAGVMALSLAACGGSGSSTSDSADTKETTTAEAAADESAAEEGGEAAEGGETAAEGATFKIGAIGPLTGAAANYGIAVQNGADLAVKEINEAGGINGYQVEYNCQDDENDTQKAVNAYNALKDWGMQMLVGTTTSQPCIAVLAETSVDNMFHITPSGSAVESISEPNAFRICFSDPDQGRASAQYIGEHGMATKIGVIYDSSTEYSTGIYESFEEEAAGQGLEIVAAGAFTSDTNTDFTVQLTECKDAGAELVFLPIYYSEASTILKQASDMGYEPQFFGCDGMEGILTVENFDTSLAEGLMLLTPFSADEEGSQDFVAAYTEAYGIEPIQFAADSYDAVYAIKAAAEKADINPEMSVSDICEALKVAMTEIEIDGLTGSGMTWTEDGEPHKEPKAVMIVNGEYEMQ